MDLYAVFFGNVHLEGESLRILVAFIGLVIASWFDVFNKRNIPIYFLYGFMILSVIINIFFASGILEFSVLVTILVSIFGYLFYRIGQMGGADVFMLASISQLLPVHPSFSSLPFNFPLILSVFLFSGVLFIFYFLIFVMYRILREKPAPEPAYLVLILPYLVFVYIYFSSPLFHPLYLIVLSLSFVSIILFYTYRKSITLMLAEKLPLSKVEPEDILALDLMDKTVVQKHKLERLVTPQDLKKFKKLRLSSLYVYTKLPPFIPFLLFGFILSLFLSSYLLVV